MVYSASLITWLKPDDPALKVWDDDKVLDSDGKEIKNIPTNEVISDNFLNIITTLVAAFLLTKLILHLVFLYKSTKSEVDKEKSKFYVQIIDSVNHIEQQIMVVFYFSLATTAFVRGSVASKFFGLAIMVILSFQFIYTTVISHDFRYDRHNQSQGRSHTKEFITFFGMAILSILNNLTLSPSIALLEGINILNCVIGATLLVEFYFNMHFITHKTIQFTYLIINLIYTFEAFLAAISLGTDIVSQNLDLDYMMLLIFMLVVNLFMIYWDKKLKNLSNKFVYKIDSVVEADQYMEYLALLFRRTNNKKNQLKLFSIMKNHYSHCGDIRCLCFLLRYKISHCTEKRLIDQMVKIHQENAELKLILYDDAVAMNILMNEHYDKMEDQQEKALDNNFMSAINKADKIGKDGKNSKSEFKLSTITGLAGVNTSQLTSSKKDKVDEFLVNLKSSDVTTVFASFFNILMSQLNGDKFILFTSYLSFLIYEVENYVGSLIFTYNFIYSREYQSESSIFKNILMQNFLHISQKKIHKQFIDSSFWLTSKRFYQVFEYFETVDVIEKQFYKIVDHHMKFYKELQETTINYKDIRHVATDIFDLKKAIVKNFDNMLAITHNNSKLVSLWINYKLNIEFATDFELQEKFQLLHDLINDDKTPKTLEQLKKEKNQLNIYANQGMSVFVNVLKSQFYVSKFSSNMPKFFDIDAQEMKGMLLSDLMPIEIRREHDRYVLDYVNQKRNSIVKTASLTSFAVTKSGKLKVLTVIIKLEYYMTDDIYLAGFLVPHPRNKSSLILSNMNGKIIAMNQRAKNLIGTTVVDNPYSLFLSIPLLMKYFYPSIEDHLRFKKFSSRANKMKTSGKFGDDELEIEQNFQLETEKFTAFMFKYLLDSKVKLKGLVSDQSAGILSNFGFQDISKWNGLRSLNSKMMLPRHLKILSRVISKNRELVKNMDQDILKVDVTIETYKHRGNLTFKLIVLDSVKKVNTKVKTFFRKAAENLKGEMADVFMVNPRDINNLCKALN